MPNQDEGIVAQRHGLDFRMIQRARDTYVRFAVKDHLQHVHGIAGPETDHDIRIRRLIILQHVRQEVGANGKGGGNSQGAAGGRLQLMHGLPGQGHGP
jgi:hypothetical protein